VRGEIDGNGSIDTTDATVLLRALFLSGPQPGCLEAADIEGNDRVDLTDAILLLEHLLIGGMPPAAPYPECGQVRSAVLSCDSLTANCD
jgi:hypothetical protein